MRNININNNIVLYRYIWDRKTYGKRDKICLEKHYGLYKGKDRTCNFYILDIGSRWKNFNIKNYSLSLEEARKSFENIEIEKLLREINNCFIRNKII